MIVRHPKTQDIIGHITLSGFEMGSLESCGVAKSFVRLPTPREFCVECMTDLVTETVTVMHTMTVTAPSCCWQYADHWGRSYRSKLVYVYSEDVLEVAVRSSEEELDHAEMRHDKWPTLEHHEDIIRLTAKVDDARQALKEEYDRRRNSDQSNLQ